MKKVMKFLGGVVLCLFELVAGVLLLIKPASFTTWIIRCAGVALAVMGVVNVIKYFKSDIKEASLSRTMVKGMLSLLAGGFCVFKTEWFFATFPVLAVLYGVIILVNGVDKIQIAVDMIRKKNKKWFWAAINAVVSIVCSIVIINNPFTSMLVLWTFTGISLIAEGVLDILTMIFGGKAAKEVTAEPAAEAAVEPAVEPAETN